ncbi:MAG: Coenzyme F420 hydrogenase/dehydrogenase, beta subunit C-terminal domain [Paludibacteraceae bacterium]|nr:Coenzyme F420 hydrogenase/dehydrogenase, beta subunit C-terminal domain [Paludibacteraceae bacterium]
MKTKKQKICISGVTLSGNMGGQAMLLSTIDSIHEKIGDVDFDLLSIYYKKDKKSHIKCVNVVPTDLKKLILMYFPLSLLLCPFKKVKMIRKLLVRIPYFKSILTSNLVIDLGGITFVDSRGLGLLLYNIACIFLPIALGVPVIKLSQAMGPFDKPVNKICAKFLLSKCVRVVARGKKTFEYVKNLGLKNINMFYDTAFCLTVPKTSKKQAQVIFSKYEFKVSPIIISPSRVLEDESAKHTIDFKKELLKFIDNLACNNENILLVAHSTRRQSSSKNNDIALCEYLYENSNYKDKGVWMLPHQEDSRILREIIGFGKIFIGCRFHSVVSALSQAVPTIAISWNHKYAEMIEPFDISEFVVPTNELSSKMLLVKVASLNKNLGEVKKRIEKNLSEVITSSKNNFNIVSTLLHPVNKTVQEGNCIGCGFCTLNCERNFEKGTLKDVDIEMTFNQEKQHFTPTVNNLGSQGFQNFVCPGDSMDMPGLSKQVYDKLPSDYLLGVYKKLRVCYSSNEETRSEAASGGLIPEIIRHLLDSNKIELAYVLHPGHNPYSAKGVIISKPEQLTKLHGSVYHPTNFGASLKELVSSKGKFAFVGLPCQIAGLEMYKLKNPEFAKRHFISLGLFCGGVNTFDGIDYYLNGFNLSLNSVKKIQYRYGTWPGKIKVEFENKVEKVIPRIKGNTRMKILRYVVAFQGYWMLQRCRLCPDQISDFADISVGDPHLEKYKKLDTPGYSAVITRSNKGEEIISKLIKDNKLHYEDISREEMIDSQGYTLDNRRHSLAYQKVNKLFGGKNPNINYYPQVKRNLKPRHYVYAFVDLIKIKLPKNKFIRSLYIPIQVFEYLFITLTPSIIIKRARKLLKNT